MNEKPVKEPSFAYTPSELSSVNSIKLDEMMGKGGLFGSVALVDSPSEGGIISSSMSPKHPVRRRRTDKVITFMLLMTFISGG